MRKIDKIIIHCSATPYMRNNTINDIRAWHLQRGYKDVGYHYVIMLDGTLQKGRQDNVIGAHCKGLNRHSIGICYIGGLGKDGKPADTRTLAQRKTLSKLIGTLKMQYPGVTIHGHNEFSKKACPCFNVQKEL